MVLSASTFLSDCPVVGGQTRLFPSHGVPVDVDSVLSVHLGLLAQLEHP